MRDRKIFDVQLDDSLNITSERMAAGLLWLDSMSAAETSETEGNERNIFLSVI